MLLSTADAAAVVCSSNDCDDTPVLFTIWPPPVGCRSDGGGPGANRASPAGDGDVMDDAVLVVDDMPWNGLVGREMGWSTTTTESMVTPAPPGVAFFEYHDDDDGSQSIKETAECPALADIVRLSCRDMLVFDVCRDDGGAGTLVPAGATAGPRDADDCSGGLSVE